MDSISTLELKTLGRMAAEDVAGQDAVEQVEVTEGEDASERPVYYFSVLIHQEPRPAAGGSRPHSIGPEAARRFGAARGDGH